MTSADPFGTVALRRAVLKGWAASAARFREDANAEESLAVGGYADRVLIELIANAVDAARQTGEPARVRVRWLRTDSGAELRVANTGAPLTAAGVIGLATLRASAKRDDSGSVGHFGVGFTAVAGVSDAPQIVSSTGGIGFDRAATAQAIASLGVADLDAEVRSRGGQVPALRLPWPLPAETPAAPAGFVTEVRLPIRTESEDRVRRALDDLGPAIFWALPGLAELELERPDTDPRRWQRRDETGVAVIDDDGKTERFRIAVTDGIVPAALLAGRPVEERSRNRWRISWIVPLQGRVPVPAYLGAPTPTDEPLSLPAELIGTFPVDDTRRRLATGPLTDHLLRAAAAGYVDLVMTAPVDQRLALVPAAGFPLGPVDALLRGEVLSGLAEAPILRTAVGEPIAPVDALVLPGVPAAAAALLGEAVPGLLLPPDRGADLDALRLLGVRVLPLAEAVSALAGLQRGPDFWRQVYAALDGQPSDNMADIPVPLAGGGRRIGARGCLLPVEGELPDGLIERACTVAPTLPVIHPAAAHPLLARLGAEPADANTLVRAPALEQVFLAFREDLEESDPDPSDLDELATLALDLVTAGARSGASLMQVVLTDNSGEAWPAADLLFPDAPLAALLADDADLPVLGHRWMQAYPPDVLHAVGVRTGLPVITIDEPAGPDADLPDLEQWWSEVIGDRVPPDRYTAIADLDLFGDDAWPAVLSMLAADPAARDTLTFALGQSYTGWWLSKFAEIRGQRLGLWRSAEAADLTGLYDELPIRIDPTVASAVGVLTGLDQAWRDDPAELLRRYADPARRIPSRLVITLTPWLARLLHDHRDFDVPDGVRAITGEVVHPDSALVLDQPWLAAVLPAAVVVPAGGDADLVSRAFNLDLASEVVRSRLVATGAAALPEELVRLAGQALGVRAAVDRLRCLPDLSVRVEGSSDPIRVTWWRDGDQILVDGTAAGVGRAVAYLAGRWADRQLAVAAARGTLLGEFAG